MRKARTGNVDQQELSYESIINDKHESESDSWADESCRHFARPHAPHKLHNPFLPRRHLVRYITLLCPVLQHCITGEKSFCISAYVTYMIPEVYCVSFEHLHGLKLTNVNRGRCSR